MIRREYRGRTSEGRTRRKQNNGGVGISKGKNKSGKEGGKSQGKEKEVSHYSGPGK